MTRARVLLWVRRNVVSAFGIVLSFLVIMASLLAPILAPYDPAAQDLITGLTGPSHEHLLGTDQLGRDILSRLLWGGRFSISASIIVLLLSLLLGVVIGILSGYLGGLVGQIFMGVVDLFLSVPTVLLSLAIIGALGPGLSNLTLALTVTWWPVYARLARSNVLAVMATDYVLAAETLGASESHIMRRHLLPALVGPVVVLLSMDVGRVMLTIAGLSFLGLGIQPPTPEWGIMLVDARPFMSLAPHLVVFPGLAILITVYGFNSLGEGLDNWLNPWMQT